MGLATATRLARAGAKVAMLDVAARADVKAELPAGGLYVKADVRSEQEVRRGVVHLWVVGWPGGRVRGLSRLGRQRAACMVHPGWLCMQVCRDL